MCRSPDSKNNDFDGCVYFQGNANLCYKEGHKLRTKYRNNILKIVS